MNLSTAFRSHTPLMRGLIGLYTTSGIVHLVRPQVFEPTVPRQLPHARGIVYVSGVAELACAAGLLDARTRKLAGAASAALLVAVLPANVEMACQAQRAIQRRGSSPAREATRVGTFLRVPLQWPLIKASLDVARARA